MGGGGDALELPKQTFELVEPQGIGAIRQSPLGGFMDLDEDCIDSYCDRGAGQRFDKLGLTAGCCPRRAGKLDAVGGIEDHGPSEAAHGG